MSESTVEFDVRAFTLSAQGRFREELDLDAFAGDPLRPDDRVLIRFLARAEGASMEQLRDVLMTATHKDARVTAFLVTWAFEKQWIADALDAVLEAHDELPARSVAEGPRRRRFAERRARRGPLRRVVASIRPGAAIVGGHLATGLIDEWVMRTAYAVLAGRAGNSALSKVLDRIGAVKQRHEAFFTAEVAHRLSDARCARFARAELRHAVWPMGAVHRAAGDRDHFTAAVFAGADGRDRAAEIGTRVAAVAGLGALTGAAVDRGLRR